MRIREPTINVAKLQCETGKTLIIGTVPQTDTIGTLAVDPQNGNN